MRLRRSLLAFVALLATPQHATCQDKPVFDPDPVIDLSIPNSADHVSADIRDLRDRRYDLPSDVFPEGVTLQEPKGLEETIGGSFHEAFIAALPVHDGDTFVIGTVKGIATHLSHDRHNLYTEFSVAPERVIAHANSVPLRSGQSLDMSRQGGAVRFPSGKILRLRDHRTGFPRLGQKYLFFLKYRPETSDFNLITGYQLLDSKVIPLDVSGPSKYKDANQATLMSDLQKEFAKWFEYGLSFQTSQSP